MRVTTNVLFKLCLCVLSGIFLLSVPAVTMAQQEPAQKQGKKIPLEKAIRQIEKKFRAHFAYEHNLLAGRTTTTAALEGDNLSDVLKNVLYPNNLLFLYVSENSYSIVARDASFFRQNNNAGSTAVNTPEAMVPATHGLKGIVMDEQEKVMPFVNVWVKGTRRGTQTDTHGAFTLDGIVATDTLVFSFVGYKNSVIVAYNQPDVTVQLYPADQATLQQVTIVSNGLQQVPKERTTGSFATITAQELEQVPVPNVLQRLEGQLSGVKINVMSGDRSFIYSGGNQLSINGGTRTVGKNDYDMSIRGTSTLQGETFPLIVVDGAITDLDISTLNPNDIDNITFLKDAAAASIWGVRAANGVIVVTTKKGRNNQTPAISFSTNFMIAEKPNLGYQHTMNAAQMLDYEAELVDRGFIIPYNTGSSSYSEASLYPNLGAVLALKLKDGSITQAQYDAAVDSLSAINNTSQIQDYILQPASSQQYNLSINGGNDKSSYFYSASYSRELPNARRTEGKRLTLTLNNSWKLFKIATLSTSLKGSFFHYDNNGMGVNSLYPSRSRNVLMPYMQLADAGGKGISYDLINPDFTATLPAAFVNWQYNYLDELNNGDDVQKDNNYVANINLDVPIYKGLSASVLYTNERSFSNHASYFSPETFYYRNTVNYNTSPYATTGNGLGITSGGIYSIINTTVNNYALRGQLSYNATLNRIHQVSAIAGSEMRETNTGQGSYTLYGYNKETGLAANVSYLSSAYTSIYGYSTSIAGAPSQADKRRRFLSYFANASYTLLDKYSLSGSVRYDDYNNFGLNRKYRATPLWSAGLKWALSKETFMKDIDWVNNLGVRLTYGVNGNISTTNYPFTKISLGGNDWTTGLPYASVISLANPELKWEKTVVTNIGVDFGLFNNTLNGSVDYYYKDGRDLLYSFPINAAYAGTIGSGYLTRNAATMTGKGVDANLNVRVLHNRDWTWNMGLTFSYNTNKITENRFDTSTLSTYTVSYAPSTLGNIAGYPSNKLLVFRYAGLDENGLATIYNQKGDKVSATDYISFADLKYAGNRTAPYFGGWNTTVNYHNFSLYALLTYQFGGVFLKPSIDSYITSYYSLNYSVSGDIANRWKEPGDEATTNIPGLNGASYEVANSLLRYQYSDVNVRSSDYIRLREIALSYQLPGGLVNRFMAKGASVRFGVRNLGLLWKANDEGYDPDFVGYANGSYSLPASRSYNFSLKLDF